MINAEIIAKLKTESALSPPEWDLCVHANATGYIDIVRSVSGNWSAYVGGNVIGRGYRDRAAAIDAIARHLEK